MPGISESIASNQTVSVRPLVIFISYASEDKQLATDLCSFLEGYLGKDFAGVVIDTESFRHGIALNDSIREQLKRTDILVVVYTGQSKPSHGFTGIELGFFLGLPPFQNSPVTRRIITFYRDTPPEAAAELKGVRFGLDKPTLQLSVEEYTKVLERIDLRHPIPAFLKDLESDVNAMRGAISLPQDERYNDVRRLEHSRSFLAKIFTELRKAIDSENAPQKKLVIKVSERLGDESIDLPGAAILVPEGNGTMAIFGLPEREITWQEFYRTAKPKYRNAWKDAIETAAISSLGENIVDNSQIIISHTGLELYRVMLSRAILFLDSRREFHLYFVEITRRHDFGNKDSTRLLRALGLCCRFRFMFFEKESEFSAEALMLAKDDIKEWARKLIRELNLMKRDAQEAELDSPAAWRFMVDPKELLKMNADYAPIEAEMYAASQQILASEDPVPTATQNALIVAVTHLKEGFYARNAQLIRGLGVAVSGLPDNVTNAQRPV
jgi:hypothetical protein